MSGTNETQLRERMAEHGKALFDRGLTFGSAGNISVRLDDGWLLTPTNSCLGRLDPARIAKLDDQGRLLSGDPPSKEAFMHRAVYEERAGAQAVVHLHSTHSVAVSCLHDIDHSNVLPPLTAYYVKKIGTLPLVPYFRPGDPALGDAIREYIAKTPAVLLANHGPVVAGKSLDDAIYATEELEETAKLFLLLQNHRTRPLTPEQIEDLRAHFPS
jgi:ribulose-5-phosphate 4-epimerase/fuculose-1-phosphate aldolase